MKTTVSTQQWQLSTGHSLVMLQMLKDSVSALSFVASAVWELEDKLPGKGARGVRSNACKGKANSGGMRTGLKWLSPYF